jgi:hypothetical protein
MADFTLNTPGTVNNPWTPSNVIIPVSTIQTDATGAFSSAAGTMSAFAHNATYGSTITTTINVAAGAASNGDEFVIGALVRSGANAGGIIGIRIGAFSVIACTCTGGGTNTNISSSVTITRATNDVFTCTVSISGGVATITGKQNSNANFSFSANTTTTFASETSLASGAQINPFNNNSLKFSQFTGTGVNTSTLTAATGSFSLAGQNAAIGPGDTEQFGSFSLAGQAATLTQASGNQTILCAQGAFNVVGGTSTNGVIVPGQVGIFTLNGQSATLINSGAGSGGKGSLALLGAGS